MDKNVLNASLLGIIIILLVVIVAQLTIHTFDLELSHFSAESMEEGMMEEKEGEHMTMETMEFAPVPETAMGPAIDQEKGYLVDEIEGGLYWVTDGTYNIMFLTTGEGVIVVDAPPNLGEKMLNAIADVTEEEITHVVYSHAHADHIAAAHLFPADAVYIAHEEAAALIARGNADSDYPFGVFLGGSPVPEPTITFSDSYTLEVGTQTLELEYKGPNHSPGNIFIYAPDQNVLMLVDVIFPGWAPFLNLAIASDVPAFIQAHDDALAYDFETFVGGHLTRLGTREDVQLQKEYILDMRANAVKALETVDFFAIGEETGFENQWLLIDTYINALSQECADLTIPDWKDRLGGVDIVTKSHCFELILSLRVD